MKKSILLFAFLTFSLFSCSSDSNSDSNPNINANQIIGTWILQSATINGEEVGSSDEIEFTNTQRAFFTYYNFGTNGEDITENGDYSISGNTLNIQWDLSGSTQYQILELTSSKLKIKSVDSGETLIEVYTK